MLLVLKRGLEENRHSAALWPLYLSLYLQQPGALRAAVPVRKAPALCLRCPPGASRCSAACRWAHVLLPLFTTADCSAEMMVDSALQFAPHSYQLWLVAAAQQREWRGAAAVLQRGVLALCKPQAPGGGKAGASGLPEQQAAAALDLGLQLLQLLSSVGDAEAGADLLHWAGADVGGGGDQSLARRSKAALLTELLLHPRLLCLLCCCCAHAAAHGGLPAAAQHSLGFQQPQLAALLQGWPAPPPPAPNAAAAAACQAALIAGAGSLGLLDIFGGKHLLQQKRQLSQHHTTQLAAAQARLAEQQPAELLAAQCGLLLAVMRLDPFAGHPTPDGGIWGGNPSVLAPLSGGWGLPVQRAALVVAQQRWQAMASWGRHPQQQQLQPPLELLLLVQEAAVAAAAADAAPRPFHGSSGNPVLLAVLQGRLHPAAAAGLAAAVASSGHEQAAGAARELLGAWAQAYEAAVSGWVRIGWLRPATGRTVAACLTVCITTPATWFAPACRMRERRGPARHSPSKPCWAPAPRWQRQQPTAMLQQQQHSRGWRHGSGCVRAVPLPTPTAAGLGQCIRCWAGSSRGLSPRQPACVHRCARQRLQLATGPAPGSKLRAPRCTCWQPPLRAMLPARRRQRRSLRLRHQQ